MNVCLKAWNFQTAEELQAALTEAIELARSEKHRPDTVYVEGRLLLDRETLTDGSQVMNIRLS